MGNDDPCHTLRQQLTTRKMTDYTAQGYKDIIVTLEGSILTVLINRPKQCASILLFIAL